MVLKLLGIFQFVDVDIFETVSAFNIHFFSITFSDQAKPSVRMGRKAAGPRHRIAGLPER